MGCNISKESRKPNPLGVSVFHLLKTFLKESVVYFEGIGKNPSTAKIYDLENLNESSTGFIRQKGENVMWKEDGRLGASYVDCLEGEDHVGPATHMLSYSWGNNVVDIVHSLNGFCESNDLNIKQTYIWICCLCNNQHRVKEKMESGENVSTSEFEANFLEKVTGIKNVLSLMMPLEEPINLTRIWCIYEIYIAITTKGCNLNIIMPPGEKVKLIDTIESSGGADKLLSMLVGTRIQDANASVEADRVHILQLVEDGVGYDSVNVIVNERLRGWIDESIVEMLQKAEDDSEDATIDTDLGWLYNQIGVVYRKNGKYDVAIEHYKKYNIICKKVHGEEHQWTATGYCNIGDGYNYKGDYELAMEYYMKCLPIEEKLCGKEHPNTAITYSKIGTCYDRQGDHDSALPYHKKYLSINEKTYGNEHPKTGIAYCAIGLCHSYKGEYEVAREYYLKYLSINEKTLGKEHSETGTSYYNIGSLYYDMGNFKEAAKCTEMALKIYEKVLGKYHPNTLNARSNYDLFRSKM